MPSPFPGMDPWLEGSLWPDVHGSLIYTMRAALAAQLPEGYFANVDQYVWLGETGDDSERPIRRGKPDLYVSHDPEGAIKESGPTSIATKPNAHTLLAFPKAIRKKRYIRILDTSDRKVVTVIELLSPSDKQKKDRVQYLAKRAEYLAGEVNLVEIDLLRRGRRVPMGKPEPPEADYYMLICLASARREADVWAFTVRERIPVIPVPLKLKHGSIPLDIQACLNRAYDDSKYSSMIDYASSPKPPLRKHDAEWADELLKRHNETKSK